MHLKLNFNKSRLHTWKVIVHSTHSIQLIEAEWCICVSKLTIIGSDNGLILTRRPAIIWTNAGILLIGTLGTNFSEILCKIHTFSFMTTILSRPQCVKNTLSLYYKQTHTDSVISGNLWNIMQTLISFYAMYIIFNPWSTSFFIQFFIKGKVTVGHVVYVVVTKGLFY